VQGDGSANKLRLNCPKLLRFNELSEDEFFTTEAAAKAGVTFKNISATEPLVMLRWWVLIRSDLKAGAICVRPLHLHQRAATEDRPHVSFSSSAFAKAPAPRRVA
jgi:hypothetical protein